MITHKFDKNTSPGIKIITKDKDNFGVPEAIQLTQAVQATKTDGIENIKGTIGDCYLQYSFELPDDVQLTDAKAITYNSSRSITAKVSPNFAALKTSLYTLNNGTLSASLLLNNFHIIEIPVNDNANNYSGYSFVPLLYIDGIKIPQDKIGIFRINTSGRVFILLDKNDQTLKTNYNITESLLTDTNTDITVRIKYKEYSTKTILTNDAYHVTTIGNDKLDTFNGSLNYSTYYNNPEDNNKIHYGVISTPSPYSNVNTDVYIKENAILDKTKSAFDTFNKLRFDDSVTLYILDNNKYYELNSSYFSMMLSAYDDINAMTNPTSNNNSNNDFYVVNKTNNDYIKRYKHLLLASAYSSVNDAMILGSDENKAILQTFTPYNYIWLANEMLSKIHYVNKKMYPPYINLNVNNGTITKTDLYKKLYIFKPSDIMVYNYDTGELLVPGIDFKFIKYTDNTNVETESYRYDIKLENNNIKKIEIIPEYSTSSPLLLAYNVTSNTTNEYILYVNNILKDKKILTYNVKLNKNNCDVFSNKLCNVTYNNGNNSITIPNNNNITKVCIYLYDYNSETIAVGDLSAGLTQIPTNFTEILSFLNTSSLSNYNNTFDFIGSKYKILTDPSVILYEDTNNETTISTSYVPYDSSVELILDNDEVVINTSGNNISKNIYIYDANNDDSNDNCNYVANKISDRYNNNKNNLSNCNDTYINIINNINNTLINNNNIYNNLINFAINYISSYDDSDKIKSKTLIIDSPYRMYNLTTDLTTKPINNLYTYNKITITGYTNDDKVVINKNNEYITNTLTNESAYTSVHNHIFTFDIDDNKNKLINTGCEKYTGENEYTVSYNWCDPFSNTSNYSKILNDCTITDNNHIDDDTNNLYPKNIIMSLDLLSIGNTFDAPHTITLNNKYVFNNRLYNEDISMSKISYIISHKYNNHIGYLFKSSIGAKQIAYIQLAGCVPEEVPIISKEYNNMLYSFILAPEEECIIYYYNSDDRVEGFNIL